MKDYTWIEMMEKMQDIRLFATMNVRHAKKEGITSAQEMDMLSRIVLSKDALTPRNLSAQMRLGKSAVSRLIDRLEKKGFLQKQYSPTDKRSYRLIITESGNSELDQTYRYYLDPVYHLRDILGTERFEQLTQNIHEANLLLQTETRREFI